MKINDEKQELYIIGEYIRMHRRKYGYSQEQLAEDVNVSKMTISRIENGENAMSILLFFQILKVLAVPEKDITEFIRNCHEEKDAT